ncbi:MAG: hypothetical protein EOP82_29775 [Variovorax sp.]|nr:MAG: hypothetical protein EOP82_29775 [Variovorax sp.]
MADQRHQWFCLGTQVQIFEQHLQWSADESFGRNIENSDLRNLNFTGANLSNVRLTGATLTGANFFSANFAGAISRGWTCRVSL